MKGSGSIPAPPQPRFLIAYWLAPALLAALWVALHHLWPGTATAWIPIVAMKLFAAGACAATALRFSRRDYFFRAWGLLGLNPLLLAIKDVVVHHCDSALFGFSRSCALTPQANVARTLLLIAGNAVGLLALMLFTRALQAAGLPMPLTRWQRIGVAAGFSVLGLLLSAGNLAQDLTAVFSAHWLMTGELMSDLTDVASIVLIAPLLLTALRFSGGVLAWPFALLAASSVSYLVLDVLEGVTRGPRSASLFSVGESFVLLNGLGYLCAAALIHHHILESMATALRSRDPGPTSIIAGSSSSL